MKRTLYVTDEKVWREAIVKARRAGISLSEYVQLALVVANRDITAIDVSVTYTLRR